MQTTSPMDLIFQGTITQLPQATKEELASKRMQSILESIPKPVSIAAYVDEMEAQRIYSDPDDDVAMETESINLQPFIESELLHVVPLENESEAAVAVSLSAVTRLDTGEAISAAIALHRSWSLATDDKAAISFFARQVPHLETSPRRVYKSWQ
jgi:hypothetical protein